MNVSIQNYYCCKDAEYLLYKVENPSDTFIKFLETIGDEAEIFYSSFYDPLWDILLEIEPMSVGSSDFMDADYKFWYIICE